MKSIDFIKDQVARGMVEEGFPTTGWDETEENTFSGDLSESLKYILTKAEYDIAIKGKKIENIMTRTDTGVSRKIKAECVEEGDFQYFLSRQMLLETGDNVLNSTNDMIKDTFTEMMEGSTYYAETAPKNYEENYMDYDLKYTCGDLVVKFNIIDSLDEEGNPIQNEDEETKNNRGVLITVVLPLAVKYVKQKAKKEEIKDE